MSSHVQWLAITAVAAVVVGWQYALTALYNPDMAWSAVGLLAHAALDFAATLVVLGVAVSVGRRLVRRFVPSDGASDRSPDLAGALTAVGAVCLVFLALSLPLSFARDGVHERFGAETGLYLAEVQRSVVTSDLTVRESTQLCSFAAVRDPNLVGDGAWAGAALLRTRLAVEATLQQLAVLLPLWTLFVLFGPRRRRHQLLAAGSEAVRRRVRRLGGVWLRPARLAGLGVAALVLFCTGLATQQGGAPPAWANQDVGAVYDACRDGGPVREVAVSAIDVTITLNRWGDHVSGGYMYALDPAIPRIRAFEAALEADRMEPESLDVERVSFGLRDDPIAPLVLRANLGECLRVHFTNRLDDGPPASMHILGLPHRVENASSAVGFNPDTFAARGETLTYEIPIPLDPQAERGYYVHDHGAGRQRQNMGLFGAIVVEPRGSSHLNVETGEPLAADEAPWEAIIVDPNLDVRPDGKSFREFVLLYHEIGDEAFTDIRDREDKKLPLVDDIAGVYRPAARAINYRSEPFRRRLEVEKTGKSLGYASYPFGDPATPVPRSYVGEGVKTRLMHGGSEVFHVHHLHGGGDRWRRNPDADPANDFWKGLTKVPDPNLTSVHLDSQSIGPGTSYNLEHECGAGGCQQSVGDFLFHCHIGHHYISGMWSFWRVFGTEQTAETNLYGRPLAEIPELFQNPANPLSPPSPPEAPVSAGGLLGLTVDGGRTIVADADVVDSSRQIGVFAWIARQLPPQGKRLDKFDATVWDWISTGEGSDLRIWGEPESDEAFAGWVSPTPGERPEVLFNPKNGRYVWPLFRPQKGQRPPFTARHSGAPWLGEDMQESRVDGLCARNGVDPSVDVGNAVNRFYPVSSIALPLQITRDKVDPDGQIFVLNEEEQAIRSGEKAAEPLTIRSNVGDCVELVFTNKIPDGPINKDFSKTNIHSHFVQFDPQASDGVITGMSYEQSVRPIESEDRQLTVAAPRGTSVLAVNHTERLRTGIWLGVGLGEGTCGVDADGQPEPCTEIRKIVDLDDTSITLDRPLDKDHQSGEAVGVEFVRYRWYSDVDFGTVFFHTHVEFKDWDHGLFGTHIVEPAGSRYFDPSTGEEIRAGALADIHVDPRAGANPVAAGVEGSFREFVLYLHDNNPTEGRFFRGGGTINLRAEPWRLREDDDPAWLFSSVRHGDPLTPLVRAYVGDPLVIRGMGVVERVGGVRVTGHRFQKERYSAASDTRDATFIGISERFDVSLEGGAGGRGGQAGDYLYYSTLGRDFESGGWGILRVHDTAQGDLQPLPDRQHPAQGAGHPRLAMTGEAPPSLDEGPGDVCPAQATVREYSIVIDDASIVYNELEPGDPTGVVYHAKGQPSGERRAPLVLRANAGDCLELNVRNVRDRRASISLGEVVFDPQRSYGAAIGLNHDSTIPAGSGRMYRYYADRELGLVLGVNLAEPESIARGAFAGVVIEPEGSTYLRPGRGEPLPQGGLGVQADIVTPEGTFREMVALFSDQDRRMGQSAMPYPKAVEGRTGLSYAAEPLALRGMGTDPTGVFKSTLWGDPRHVVTVPAGTPLVYRVGHAWGDQVHVPTLEGHRWWLEPGLAGSEQVFNDVLAPGMTLDLPFVGGAGGDIAAPGDYLFLDRRQPFLEAGLWHILRVTDDGTSGADDRVDVRFVDTEPRGDGHYVSVRGATSLRPAGDFAPSVEIYAGTPTASGCSGSLLGTTGVDPGSGAFWFRANLDAAPDEVCVASPGGGVGSKIATVVDASSTR
ncbi:MAG: multicopper oxidase domain-containing protein [Acidobacteriota bacterium]